MKNKIFIGDNLTIMQSCEFQEYKNAINFIYIDPPYNTANNAFAFNDKNICWSDDIYKRLIVAKEMLKKDGVIFISIDNNELANLMLICDDVFGKENFVGLFVTKQAQRSNAKHINTIHEYILCFAKNKKLLPKFYIQRIENPSEADRINTIITKVKNAFKRSRKEAIEELKKQIDRYVKETGDRWIKNYSNIDDEGNVFFAKDLSTPSKPNELFIEEIGLHLKPLATRGWSSREKFIELYNKKRLCYKKGRPYAIEYLHEATNNVPSILDFYSRQGTNDLKKLGLNGLFDTPKPVELVKFLIRSSQHRDALILDFYAGSGTTAQAVYEINEEDNTNHNYILIQLDERINAKSAAYDFMINKGISNPSVDKAMLLRIDAYLQQKGKAKDYVLYKNS